MAGPLSGLTGQTAPLSSPFQPGQNNTPVRGNEEQKPQENRVQPKKAAAAETQDSLASKREDRALDERRLASLSDQERADSRRGSLVDITV
jgi:hypothetical protein